MKKNLVILLIFLTGYIPHVTGQGKNPDTTVYYFSLEETRAFAAENNYDVINALKDIEIARKQVKETTAIGLPQVDASIAYTDNIDIPVMPLPGEFALIFDPTWDIEKPFPAKFGTKYNMTAAATVSQLIFSGEYIVGLQASRVFVDLSQKQYDKMVIELDRSVAESYYLVLIAERNKTIVDSTLLSLREIRAANQALYENGFIEDTDVDQVDLLISDLEATLVNIENNLGISKNLLKFTMGLKLENEIVLTDDLDQILDRLDNEVLAHGTFNYRKNIDYKILENQQELAHLDLKRYKSQYLPQLYTFFTYQENAYRQQWDFLNFDEDWYKTTIWGVQLDIPVFQSGARSSKVSQAKIQLDKLAVIDEKLQSGLNIQVSTVRNNFLNAWKVYQNRKQGLDLSFKIYDKTRQKLQEGVSSTIELQQNYNQYLNSESDYVMSIMDLLNNKLELEMLLTEYDK